MKLKPYIDLLDESKKSTENVKEETNNLTIKEIEDKLNNNTIINLKSTFLISKIVETFDSETLEKVNNILNNTESSKQSILIATRSELMEKNPGLNIPSLNNLDYSKSKEIMDGFLTTPLNKSIYEEKIKNNIALLFRRDQKDVYDKISEFIDPSKEEKIVDECEKHNKEFENFKSNRTYNVELEDDIDKLLNSSNSKELKDALKYAKENILKRRTDEDLAEDAIFAEDVISTKKKIVNTNNIEKLNEDKYFGKYMEYFNGTYMFKTGISSFDDEQELNNELSKHEIKLSNNTKEILKSAFKKLDQMKDYKTGEPLFNLNEYASEESTKRYAFKNLIDISDDYKEAITNGDSDKIIDLTNKYKDMTNKMDSLISDLNKLDPSNYPGNISIARTKSAPTKYAEDYKSSSLVNGMWHLLAFSKASGIGIDELVEKPIESVIKYTEKNKGLPELDELGKNGDIDFITNALDNKKISGVRRDIRNKYNNFRSFEFLTSIDNKNLEESTLSFQYIKQAKFITYFADKNKLLGDTLSKLNKEGFKNILLNQDIKRSYADILNKGVDLNNTKFDANKFMEKVEAFKTACENKKFNGKEKDVLDAIKEASKEAISSKDSIKFDNFDKLCNMAGLNTYKAIRAQAGTRDIAPYVRNEFNNITKDGINKNNISLTANMFKSINDQYKNRSIFGKVFRKEGREEGKLIKEFRESLNKAGIDNNDIDKMLNGSIDIKDFSNALKDKTALKEDIVKHIEIKDNEIENDISINVKNMDKEKVSDLDKVFDNENIL